ncbi:glycosyltransferase family 25 protein [Hypomontagnella monticulosa]|nr:glycosyltransferase family 25 protein [Hypomontagnella monticulosa]
MPPYRRGFAVICIVIPLLYLYWERLTASDTLRKFRSWHITDMEGVFNNKLGFSNIFVINLPSRKDRRESIALAGAVSNLTFTWIDGVSGEQATESVGSDGDESRRSGAKGSWRSHMNALQVVVTENLTSALILEDDIDWDVRLKSQLQTFSLASKTWLRESGSNRHEIELLGEIRGAGATRFFSTTGTAREAPYGDGWDVLWLGHCGADFPDPSSLISPLKITIPEDETVPAPKHLKPHPFALLDKLGEVYPPHTRVVHVSSGNVCSLAYAVSQEGARRLLSKFNDYYHAQWDIMLQKWCEGEYGADDKYQPDSGVDNDTQELKRRAPICLTVQPPLFSHHYTKYGASNIQGQGGGYAKGTGTPYIRLSVRQNLERLVAGAPQSEMVDQLPDDGDPIWG